MLYPRTTILNGKEQLVGDDQMTTYREHMSSTYRLLYVTGLITGETSLHDLLMTFDTLSHDPIKLVITSVGGELDSTFLLCDTIKMIKSPVITIGRYCASAAAILLAAGSKRYLYPHAKIMLHLPAGQMGGDAKDWDIQHKQMEMYRNKIVQQLIASGVKKTVAEILADIDRDYWLEPEEAIEYGLADEILTTERWGELCP